MTTKCVLRIEPEDPNHWGDPVFAWPVWQRFVSWKKLAAFVIAVEQQQVRVGEYGPPPRLAIFRDSCVFGYRLVDRQTGRHIYPDSV